MANPASAFLFLRDLLDTLRYRDDFDGSFHKMLGMEARIASIAVSYAGGIYEAVKSGQVPVGVFGERLSQLGLAGTLTVSVADIVAAGETYGTSSPEYSQALGKFAIEFGLAAALLSIGFSLSAVGIVIGAAGILLPLFPQFTQPIGEAIHLAAEWLADSLAQILRDPLVLDLDGIEATPLDGSSIHFDYDGFAECTGWVSADDGMLVINDKPFYKARLPNI